MITLVFGVVAAIVTSLLTTPLYTSSVQLFVSATGATSTSDVFQGSQFSQQRIASYAQLLKGDDLATRVIDRLDLGVTPQALLERVEVLTVPETVLIDVSVEDPSPQRAQQIASALAEEFTGRVAQLESPEGSAAAPIKVTVTEAPDVASSPSSPNSLRNVAIGSVLGLLMGAGLVIARARLDRSVKSSDDVTELTGLPVIGTVIRDVALERRHTLDGVESRIAEDYRQIRTSLQFISVDEPPKVVMVSSAVPSEGKTTLVINLAIALADAGRRVTVVEADLRRPKVTRYLGLVGDVGLTNVLAGTAEIEEVRQSYRDGLQVIAAGPLPPNPGELLGSGHMAAVVDKLRVHNDIVLVDAPPLLPVADASTLAVIVDGVLLSVRHGSTRRDQLQQAVATLERVRAKPLGVVLNIVPPSAAIASAYGYGHAYGYGEHNPAP